MKDHPILFSGEMVNAILKGRKTQTRRVMKPQPSADFSPIAVEWYEPLVVDRHGDEQPGAEIFGVYSDEEGYRCPYGAPGDRLWVREKWDFMPWAEIGRPNDNPHVVMVSYAADGLQRKLVAPNDWNPTLYGVPRWRPSIHMPRWASRITLEIVKVRVERVQEISPEDAKQEGFFSNYDNQQIREFSITTQYLSLWNKINAKRCFGWDANPWVWVFEFKRLSIADLVGSAQEI